MLHPSSRRARRAVLVVHLVLSVVVLVLVASDRLGSPAGAASAPPPVPVVYQPPVDAPVTDPFRAPASPYGAGNRGIEYATQPGTMVRAVADGVVTFAGSVAGSRYVTLRHADATLTSMGPLTAVWVDRGQRVARGAALGVSGSRLHLGARRHGAYIDPATLWSRRAAVLEPLPGDDGWTRQQRSHMTSPVEGDAGRARPGWWAGWVARLRSSVGPPPGEPRPTSTWTHPNGRLLRR